MAPLRSPTLRTVVHYVDSNTYGGCEAVILLLLAGLDRRVWRPLLFHGESPGIARLLSDAARLDVACRPVRRITNRNLPLALTRLVGDLKRADTSVLHLHLNWPLGCRYVTTAALAARIPVVVATTHLCSPVDEVRFAGLKQRLRTGIIDRYIPVSRAMTGCLRTTLGIPDAKMCVIRNGIDVAAFPHPGDPAVRASWTGGTDRPVVFTPARLHPGKGHMFLLEAAAQVPDAVFVFAGDGEERSRLMDRARQLNIGDRVRFLGDREDVPALLASSDLFVLPSLAEGLPMSVLEAMAAGVPVVATSVGGIGEAVSDGVTGLLVPPADADALAAAIRRVLSSPGLAGGLARAARACVVEQFSSEAMAGRTARLYEELLDARIERRRRVPKLSRQGAT